MSQKNYEWGPDFTATQMERINRMESEASLQTVKWSPDFTASQVREIDEMEIAAIQEVSQKTEQKENNLIIE